MPSTTQQRQACYNAIELCELSLAETKALVKQYMLGKTAVAGSGGGKSISFQTDFPSDLILGCLTLYAKNQYGICLTTIKRRNRACVDMCRPAPEKVCAPVSSGICEKEQGKK